MKMLRQFICLVVAVVIAITAYCQDTIIYGYGQYLPIATASDGSADQTLLQDGYLPNENAASRFLSKTTLGYNEAEITSVMTMGMEDWIDQQLAIPVQYDLESKVWEYINFVRTETNNSNTQSSNRMWDYAWWQYHMTGSDHLRQRVAYTLSQLAVISQNSSFNNVGLGLASYYDVLLQHALGNYRDVLTDITYHPAMGRYLTYLNNPPTDTSLNRFPDENYAREIMQLFTLGTEMLNMDGTVQVDSNGVPIPTYNNYNIAELSKVFTGLTWGDRTQWNRGAYRDTSYALPMQMMNDHHEPGPKTLLSGLVIDNNPVNGDLDIEQALDDIFNHPNVPPFVSKFLIQRLVTSNPPPAYVQRVAQVFADDGQGVRGNLAAVVKAILLDPMAKSCWLGDGTDFGGLREPFIRYMQINKAFGASTLSGNFRNDMDYVYRFTSQKPLASPSVFNFYQTDYQPIGPIEEAGKVAPVFQITDSQTITGYINGLWRWVVSGNIADEYDLYSGEDNANYDDEIARLSILDEMLLTEDDKIHILIDKLNMRLAHGRLSELSTSTIVQAVQGLPLVPGDLQDQEDRVELAIYLVMTAPEYLINH